MGKKIAVVVTNLFEDSEYTEPVKAFKEAGHSIVTIEKEKGIKVKGKQGESTITIDASIDEVTEDAFDALLIPGGFSPDILRADDRFVAFAKAFADAKKPIMAICHGPQLLINAGVLKGRDVTGYKSIAVDLRNAGANFYDQEVVVCGGNLVTSRTPDDLPAFNRESLNVLT
ncbi:type 1 glutamine amidotransferase [Halalkalibacterium halodurans]|jgi:protease I|uniref:Cysteine protease n=1 Tax=Halalkalibacterium halodurans TaxID=86665 RepID=A0A0M0KHD0_ALKHA|nr:type 1 glutamine amidotransferase domain-containing protein [Halalkalibacterium halodurans]MDY7223570.1 type 1 glutamine amidotransferase domain-containing protein [Halalkalibacterium halodurans]MDY7242791.1 type 1 glutamine amidotransferase domain-containing protein [Halalkalibacterium halodurans]MED3646590.1 type 1 glutamine amidotransferase [Halalkalibacterium halodurans]MED4082223.1 type 1 glutamine amidotransferase [Halalkalibacterium halodurans]MED4084530.1 type 1 glutamine amidotrans